jgi:hypothetical protein
LSGSKREHWIAAVRELQIGNTKPAMRLVSKGRSIMGGAAESNQDDGAVRAEASANGDNPLRRRPLQIGIVCRRRAGLPGVSW